MFLYLWKLDAIQKKNILYPGFRLLQICADLQVSVKIVALNLEEPYRSAASLQKYADFFKDFCRNMFPAASKEPNYCISK